jgi:hypothetical protein
LLYLLFLPSSLLLVLFSFFVSSFQCHDAGSDRDKHHVTPHSPRLGSSLLACSVLIHHARHFPLLSSSFIRIVGFRALSIRRFSKY